MDTQIRHYKTLPEVRRVVRKLLDSLAADKAKLSGLRKAFNLSYMSPSMPTLAASSTKNEESIDVRGPGSMKGGVAAPEKELPKATREQIAKLTDLLSSRQDKLNIADHIRQLLQHYYNAEDDKTAGRMQKHTEALVKESQSMVDETMSMMHKLGETHFPPAFKGIVDDIYNELDKKFDGKYKSFDKQFSIASGNYDDAPSIFYIAYLIFKDLQGATATQDYIVVVTQVAARSDDTGPSRITKKVTKELKDQGATNRIAHNRAENYIRTLTDFRPPSWIIQYPLGKPFGKDTAKALRAVLLNMQSEDMISNIDPTTVPLLTKDLNFKHTMIDKAKIDDERDLLRIYIKPEYTDTPAKVSKAAVDIFAEVKNLIKLVHPRYRNAVRMSEPSKVNTTIRNNATGKTRQVTRFVIDFTFQKMEGEADVDMPSDKLRRFLNDLGIQNPELARKMTIQMKNLLGLANPPAKAVPPPAVAAKQANDFERETLGFDQLGHPVNGKYDKAAKKWTISFVHQPKAKIKFTEETKTFISKPLAIAFIKKWLYLEEGGKKVPATDELFAKKTGFDWKGGVIGQNMRGDDITGAYEPKTRKYSVTLPLPQNQPLKPSRPRPMTKEFAEKAQAEQFANTMIDKRTTDVLKWW